MKFRIRTKRKGRPAGSFGSVGGTRNKILLKLTKASDKTNRDKKKDSKAEKNAETKAARVALYPEGTNLNSLGTLQGMGNRGPGLSDSETRKLAAMRQFYNKKMPTPQCNGCSYANSCPQFKAGYVCAFLPMLNAHKVESVDDIRQYMRELVAANMRRVQFALTGETIKGESPGLETTEMTALAFQQLKDLHAIETDAGLEEIEVEGDESVIGQLFGNLRQLGDDTRIARAKRLNEEPPRLKASDSTRPQIMGSQTTAEEIEDGFGAIAPGVDLDLVQSYNTDQLLSRTRKKRRQSPGNAVIEVSSSKV